jgi:lipoprotein
MKTKSLLLILLVGFVSCKDFKPSIENAILIEPKEQVLEGTYVSNDGLYKSFTFKGSSTVVIKDNIFGFDFASSYERDGNLIRIRTDQSDLLLEIVTPDSLVGEGFAKGSFKKVYN